MGVYIYHIYEYICGVCASGTDKYECYVYEYMYGYRCMPKVFVECVYITGMTQQTIHE